MLINLGSNLNKRRPLGEPKGFHFYRVGIEPTALASGIFVLCFHKHRLLCWAFFAFSYCAILEIRHIHDRRRS